jgi:16S rRNA pseudouridine516 synthase
MSERQRLDKLLAHMGVGSRNEIKQLVRSGAVTVDDVVVRDSAMKIDVYKSRVVVNGEPIAYQEFIYLMMNKPAGVISATEDRKLQTVLDLLPERYRHFQLFPVGRLDKDTEGLLLLTNDGKMAHELLSPRKHVAKTYYAEVLGVADDTDIEAFRGGVTLDDGYRTLPAELQIDVVNHESGTCLVRLTITEGKFHQVKRMFAARGKSVLYLKRLAMGPLVLDDSLAPGVVRELTATELTALQGVKK